MKKDIIAIVESLLAFYNIYWQARQTNLFKNTDEQTTTIDHNLGRLGCPIVIRPHNHNLIIHKCEIRFIVAPHK